MDYTSARKELKTYLMDYVESKTAKSKGRNKYICPLCGSGTGKHHTGAFSIDDKDPTRWKCFSCGAGGDIFDLIGLLEDIPEPLEQLKRAGELYGIEITTQDATQKPAQNKPKNKQGKDMSIHTNKSTQTEAENRPSLVSYFKECQKRLKDTAYYKKRGISEKIATRFMLGYDPQFKTYNDETKSWEIWQVLIIPTGQYSYVARNTNPEATGKRRYRNKGESTPFNTKALTESTQPIFITEGEIDALSIIEAGGEAIGLGSTSNKDKFIRNYIKGRKLEQPFIIALDNDEAGKTATAELAQALNALGVSFYVLDPYNGVKDANTALLDNRDHFTNTISLIKDEVIKREAEKLEKEREAYQSQNSAYSHLQDFIDGIKASVNTPATPTGFKNLDDALDGGLYEGLYFIGAITSLGKTTLALQMADQIAQTGKDVLIFSLEMARAELMSKSISRLTLLDVMENNGDIRNAKTARGITAGARYEHYSQTERELINRAIISYGEYSKHIYIHEGIGDIGIEQIRETVEKHQRITGQAPIVIIDYVQILAPNDVRATDKQNTDKSVTELKRLSRDFKTPVIGISSFNRASYKDKVTLEAFKESGAIEYGSDVLIGLQFKGAGKDNFDSTERKKDNPRKIELVILKNRNGKVGEKVNFDYYPLFNYFKEA